ncbi:unnamed protein product [Brassicogethes aeneus]|uniref:Anillin homology domain-containing protein n=1 Tax=Brassicogethes aeneus TaxID=1431903 RepID=A0A9P0FE85_BRAAE|nr:unnamed protein product [Brassicogethes aeneus]
MNDPIPMDTSYTKELERATDFFRNNFERNLKLWRDKEKIYSTLSIKYKNKNKLNSLKRLTIGQVENIYTTPNINPGFQCKCKEENYYENSSIFEKTISDIGSDYTYYKEVCSNGYVKNNLYNEKCNSGIHSESGLGRSCQEALNHSGIYEEIPVDIRYKDSRNKSLSVDTIYNSHVSRMSEAISLQHLVIQQITKALLVCKSRPEFFGNRIHIEAERILLLASTRKMVLNSNISREMSEESLDTRNTANVDIKTITFSLNPYKQRPDILKSITYFVCLVICNQEVLSTEVATAEGGNIIFNPNIILSDKPVEYNIQIQIHAMSVKCRKKIPIFDGVRNACSKLCSKAATCFKRTMSQNTKELKISFELWGNSTITIPNIPKMKDFRLKNMECSLLHSKFNANINIVLNTSI